MIQIWLHLPPKCDEVSLAVTPQSTQCNLTHCPLKFYFEFLQISPGKSSNQLTYLSAQTKLTHLLSSIQAAEANAYRLLSPSLGSPRPGDML
jgi:hypothetical protein